MKFASENRGKEVLSKTIANLEKMEGKSLKMERDGGVYSFQMWIPVPPENRMKGNRFSPLQQAEEEVTG